MGNRILKKSNDPKASTFVQFHKTENQASGKQQLALSGVPDLMELAAVYLISIGFFVALLQIAQKIRAKEEAHSDA